MRIEEKKIDLNGHELLLYELEGKFTCFVLSEWD